MKFRTAYSGHVDFHSPVGSRYLPQYALNIGGDPDVYIVQTGLEDVYDSIQKAASGCLLDDLIRRATAGDTTAIPEVVESYVDITEMPNDLLGAHQYLLNAKESFLSLPVSLREKFNNSFEEFLIASTNGTAVASYMQLNKSTINESEGAVDA